MKSHKSVGTITLIVCTFTLTLIHALTAHAVDSSWTNTIGGNWTDPNWRNGVPGPTTNAFITNSLVAASSFTITNNVIDNTIANLTIWNLSTGTDTLLNAASGFNPTGNVILGQRAFFDLNSFSAAVGGSLVISNFGSAIIQGATLSVATNSGNASLVGGGLISITNNGTLKVGSTGQGSISNSSGTIRIGSGGTLAVGIITNNGIITTFNSGGGSGVITGSVINLTSGTTLGARGINVFGNATDASLSLLGAQPFLNNLNQGSIGIASNGTLNVGGLTAATSTASFTNRGSIAFYGGAVGTINTLNAGTLVNDTTGFLDLSLTTGAGTNFVNADVLNYGSISLNGGGVPARIFRSVSNANTGVFDLKNFAGANTVIQQGSLVNDGTLLHIFGNNLIVTNGGGIINSASGKYVIGRGQVQAAYFVQDGTLLVTNWGVTAKFRTTDNTANLSITNNGTILWAPGGQVAAVNGAFMQVNTLYNNGTFSIQAITNKVNGIPQLYASILSGDLVNQASGVINVQSNAIATFDTKFLNQGTITIQSNSVLSAGHPTSGAGFLGVNSFPTPTSFSFYGGFNGWTNDGNVNMLPNAFLAVKSLTNGPSGNLSGAGSIGPVVFQTITDGSTTQYVQNTALANIVNAGTLSPNGILNAGVITNLSGGKIIGSGVLQATAVTNFYSGGSVITSSIYTGARIQNNAGATILASGGLLVLSNGLVNNANSGTIGATNGVLQLGDGTLALTNNVTGTIFAYNGDLHLGPLRNNGTIQIVNSSVTFSNLLVNAGRYISDPSTNTFFDDVTILQSGTLEGGPGDLFDFKSDLIINSTNTSLFDLASSEASFSGGADHTNAVTGLDFGPIPIGLASSNFAYGTLSLGASDDVFFMDGDGISGNTNALYVRVVDMGGNAANVSLLHNAFPGAFHIYYDGDNPANGYLGGQTYAFSGGGSLIPLIPEPTTLTLLLLVGAGYLRRSRHNRG